MPIPVRLARTAITTYVPGDTVPWNVWKFDDVEADVRWFCSLRNHLYDQEPESCKQTWHRPNECGWRFIGKMPSE